MTNETQNIIEILFNHFKREDEDLEIEDITEGDQYHYGLDTYEIDGRTYAVGTDEQAREAAGEYINDSLWAFNSDFILFCCELPRELGEALESYQGEKCEGANEAILALIEKTCGIETFIDQAIKDEGNSHGIFLALYDHEEIELENSNLFAYRID